jgi:hypothetical protein
MSASATEQASQEIPLGLSRTDSVETTVNLPASPDSCPLEGRALTFSSPVTVVVAAVSLEHSNTVGITDGDVHSEDRIDSINMNEMLDTEDRREEMLQKVPQEQAGGKIGQHDAKIQSFQERIDQAEEQIHDLEVIMVDLQEDGKDLTTRRATVITAQLVAKRKRIQG